MNIRIKESALFQSEILPPPGTEWVSVKVRWNEDIEESNPMGLFCAVSPGTVIIETKPKKNLRLPKSRST
jgi:hypothetical protein